MEDPAVLARDLFEACGGATAPAPDLVTELSIAMFTPPYSTLLYEDRLAAVPEPMRTALATLVLDTELQMVGIVTLLGNSTGLLMPELVRALHRIGAEADARILTAVLQCLARHGLTPRRIRKGAVPRVEFTVSTFADDHPDVASTVWDEVESLAVDLGSEHRGQLVLWLEHQPPLDSAEQ